jgi:hypothetical protein
LQREDVVEDAIDPPAFEPVVCDHACTLEMPAQRGAERPVDACAASDLSLLEELQAAVERTLARSVLGNRHVPRTSTLPAEVTRVLTSLSAGSVYDGLLGLPSGVNDTG